MSIRDFKPKTHSTLISLFEKQVLIIFDSSYPFRMSSEVLRTIEKILIGVAAFGHIEYG